MSTRAQITSEINSRINDNTTQDITPLDVRTVLALLNTNGINVDDDVYLTGKYSQNLLLTRADVQADIASSSLIKNAFYRITDAVGNTREILVQAEIEDTLFPMGVDSYTGEVGTYDITTDVFTSIGGSISPYSKDADDNVFYDGVTATLGTNCTQNVFHQDAISNVLGGNCTNNTFEQGANTNELGDNCINNTFKQGANGFSFRPNLQNVTIEAGVTGDVYTSLPDYAFLYNNTYPATIFFDGTTNFHKYYDVANDRIVLTNLATLAVSYIGGSGGGITSVQAGTNISVDNTNPASPIVNSLADRYNTSSTTSNSIGNGSKTFTVDANLSYIALQEVLIVFNTSNHMHGTITSYSGTTLVVDIKNHTGSGTYTSWQINLDGTPVDAITGSGTANRLAYFTGTQVIDDAAAITAARALKSDANGIPTHFDTTTEPSMTELSYVKGVTSAIQTQLDSKQASLVSFNRQTASYTLAASDVNKMVEMNVSSANNLTVPLNSSVSIAIGSIISVSQYGAGQTTIVAASGVTLRSVGSWLKISARYGVVSLVKVGTDEWYVYGALTA